MYLKRLELQGFKSFPEKIKLEFNKGITAVVGPNGSGKSNISDAVRWVLGEQSAKSLRGAKMEDVIFSGTSSRKPLGFAEVSIIIDNEDNDLPLDYSEITITRRVYRLGESGFFINGTPCRLKDIYELFMDTGIGREGYSIIGQGQIEEILNSKGEDRRVLFEEAAGIVKYKNRRNDSLSKLEREKQNLIRVTDIISELESKLEPLKTQSEKAKMYLALTEKLKLVKINIFLNEVKKSEELLKEIKENILIIINQEQFELEKEKNLFAEHSILKENISKFDETLKLLNDELGEIRSQIEQKENDIKLLHEKNNFIDSEINRLDSEEIKKQETIDDYENEKKILENKHLENLQILKEKNIFLEEKQKLFDSLNEQMSESQIQIEKYNKNIADETLNTNNLNSYLQRLTIMYEGFESRKEQIISETNAIEEKIEFNTKSKIDIENKIITVKNSLSYLENDLKSINSEKEVMTIERNNANNENAKIIKLLSETESRHKVIKELEDDYEGYFKSTKAILKDKKSNKEKYKGIHGAIGEIVSVSAKYETAIEIALSGYVQNIVTETEEDAKIAIEFLKISKEGRATFLPLSVIKSKSLPNQSEIENIPGVCGIAKDLIEYDKKYENIMSNLLGRVIICDNIDNAIIISRKYNNSLKIVTLNGDLINSGGAMTGGSIAKKATSIFSRSRELSELSVKITELKKQNEQLVNQIQKIEKQISIIKVQFTEKQTLFHQRDMENASLTQTYEQLNEVLVNLIEKQNDFKIEDVELMEQIVKTNEDIRNHSNLLCESEEKICKIKNDLTIFQSGLMQYSKSRESKITELTDIKVVISALTQDIKAIEHNINRIERDISISKLNTEEFICEKNKKEYTKKQNIENITYEQDNISKLKLIQNNKINKTLEVSNKRELINSNIEKIESDEREQTQLISKIQNEKTRLELKSKQMEEENRRIFDTMWNEYEITYQQAIKYEKLEDSITNLYKLDSKYKNEIKNLGIINIGAIYEYKEIKERFDFLTIQKNDIIDAEVKLKDIIYELTKLMEVQFIEQFKIISENFNSVYSEIFEGGKAYLQFSDLENVLESGIEIIAKPPGKNLQNMNLLSGGERALTAIALLFAILKMKPSPFCILDEIESALDDSNVKRYANYLKKFSSNTQFILITHRKGTMVAADILYGVTMQEQGVSKLVSVELKND